MLCINQKNFFLTQHIDFLFFSDIMILERTEDML